MGNRTSRAISGSLGLTNQTFVFNTNDWLTSDAYDSNGNTTNSTSVSYLYDALNHLTNANNGAVIITYDGDGNRVSKTTNGVTTYYLVDDRNPTAYSQVLEEYQGFTLNRVYDYGLSLVAQHQTLGGTTNYYISDGHGSVRMLLNISGTLTDTYAFDAYGNLIASTGTTPNNYLYCGEQWDSDLGLYYLRTRYYQQETGRFWTMDTDEGNQEDPLSLHKYLYCESNPVNTFDPTGFSGESDAAAVGRAIHKIIGDDFIKTHAPFGFSGESIGTLLNSPGIIVKILKKYKHVSRLFPDLIDINSKRVFEMKPITLSGTAAAAVQLGGYIIALNAIDPSGGWHPGSAADYIYPPEPLLIPNPPTIVIVFPPVFGVIYYETLAQFVKTGQKSVATSETADTEATVADVFLLELL